MSSAQAEEAGVSSAAETSSPTRQAPERESGIDKLGLAIEVAKAHGKPEWDELAKRLGSASGKSLKTIWYGLAKNHVIRRKENILAPKSTKVTKPKAPVKKVAIKAGITAPKKAVTNIKDEDDVGVDDLEEDDLV